MSFPPRLSAFIIVIAAATWILLLFFPRALEPSFYKGMILFDVLIVVVSSVVVLNPGGGTIGSAGTLLSAVMFLFEPIPACLIASLGYSIGNTIARGWVAWRSIFNGAQMGLSVAIGSLAFRAFGGDLSALDLPSQIIPVVIGAAAYQISNNFFVAVFFSTIRQIPFYKHWFALLREILVPNLLGIPAAFLIALLYIKVHPLSLLVLLLVLPLQQLTVRYYMRMKDVYLSIVETFVRAGEMNRRGAAGHARRVADLAVEIARELGLTDLETESIQLAALLHDIGMIGVEEDADSSPDDSLRAKDHTRLGADIVRELPRPEIAEMVLNHHAEYAVEVNDQVRFSRTSLGARILALAEDVDSRIRGILPYTHPQPFPEVVAVVRTQRGRRFDPRVVEAFEGIVVRTEGSIELGEFVRSSVMQTELNR